jgi:hypothetical protein
VSEEVPLGVAQVIGAFGPCPEILHKGKVWKVGWPTQKAKAELETLVVKVSKENLAQLRDAYTEEEYREEDAALRALIRGGHFKTWGSLWRTVNDSPDGMPLFLCSLLKAHHPDITIATARELWTESPEDAVDALVQVVPDFFTLLIASLPETEEARTAAVNEWKTGPFAKLVERQQQRTRKTTKIG